MTTEEFQDLVDRCGERPADWPDDVRQRAVEFLASSEAAREIVVAAAELRGMLSNRATERAPARLAERIVTLAGRVDDYRPALVREKPVPTSAPAHYTANKHIRIPKGTLVLAFAFSFGLTLGLIGGVFGRSPYIDFAALFAAVNS